MSAEYLANKSEKASFETNLRKRTRAAWWPIVILILACVVLLTACQSGFNGINVVRVADLAITRAVEVQELTYGQGADRLSQGVISDPVTVQQLVKSLDRRLPLEPLADCLPQYRLRFLLADGRAEEFGYLCNGGSFLQGDQPFWRRRQIQPPAEFDLLMQKILEGL